MNPSNERIGILGAGQMGVAIAAAFLLRRFSVTLFDTSEQAVASAATRVEAELVLQNPGNTAELLTNLACTNALNEACRAALVLETITEKMRAKSRLYAEIVPLLDDSTVLVSNTSTISINALAATLPSVIGGTPNSMASRFCGFHFFHPVRERSLVEIVRGRATSTETLARTQRLANAIDKTPLVVNDGPGFVVNRLLNAYLSGSLQLLAEGATIRQIDLAAEQFGMAMGPFCIMDEIGLDVTMHGGWVLYKAFPDRVEPSPILLELVRNGQLGRKTGCGFYRYDSTTMLWNSPGRPHAELEVVIAEKYRGGQMTPLPSVTTEMILDRSVCAMFDEGRRILIDGIATSDAELELAVTLGLGFPKNRWKKAAAP
ncbi:MAG: 3-hydroxyacyl-CoA dehydrogenase family protein [Planctomycetaceae bacterium]|nr:3-hydroxyacyl-CoA dehydrogenase family protein [Planctomycetaceae bacterium]